MTRKLLSILMAVLVLTGCVHKGPVADESKNSRYNWPIGLMVWRIAEIVEPEEQIEWIRKAGFPAIGFHPARGQRPGWAGIDAAGCDASARKTLKRRLSGFAVREVHAPFQVELHADDPRPALEALDQYLEFAGDVGATVVTVHAILPDSKDRVKADLWRQCMIDLNIKASRRNLLIGLELLSEFKQLADWNLSNIGVTLDLGHMFLAGGGSVLKSYGTMGNVIRHIGPHLVHMHVHDVTAEGDHREAGKGRIDFDDVLTALSEIKYRGGMMFEYNPSFVTPEGISRSLAFMQKRMQASGSYGNSR